MERQRGIKALSIVALLVAVVGLTVAFAAMSRTLTINGTATVDPANWDIHFANLSEPTIEEYATVETAPTLTATHIGDYSVKLTRPGDSVTYTFDVINAGDINATLGTYTKAEPTFEGTAEDVQTVKDNLIYTLTYDNDSEINEGDALAAGDTAHLKLVVAYDPNADKLPAADVIISAMDVTMVYDQAD